MIVDGTPYFLEPAVEIRRRSTYRALLRNGVLGSLAEEHNIVFLRRVATAAHGFHAAIRNSKLVIYPDTGHLPQEEVADESSAEVRAFLAGHR